MSVVEVAFPVTRVRTRLTVFKGRPWSIVEHLILGALAKRPRRISELALGLNIRRGVIEEGLAKLMRTGWAQMQVATDGHLLVGATPFGSLAALQPVLPHTKRSLRRGRWLIFDQICGHVFSLGELDHFRRDELSNWANPDRVVVAQARLFAGEYRRDELIEVSLEEDEQLISVDPTPEYATDRLALVRVIDGEVEGLPSRGDFSELKGAILELAEADTSGTEQRRGRRRRSRSRANASHAKWYPIRFHPNDLVMGGQAHKLAIESVLRTAQSRVIIHSTFLSEHRFRALLPLMLKAARRNVTIDILWGQVRRAEDTREDNRPTAEDTADILRDDPDVDAYRDRLRIHTDSTRSHAKVIIADPGKRGQFVALVGSCNWLASKFDKVETSVYLRDPQLVREVLRCLIRLVQAGSGIWPELVTDLYTLGERVMATTPKSKANGKARLLIGEAHNTEILRARDDVRRTLLLVSNKLGRHFNTGALIPLARACLDRRVQVSMVYSSLRGIERPEASQFHQDAKRHGIALIPKKDPRVHAKLLAWDDNCAVISSQNWLSADPGYTALATELGISIDSPGIGALVRQTFGKCVAWPGSNRGGRRGRNSRFRSKRLP